MVREAGKRGAIAKRCGPCLAAVKRERVRAAYRRRVETSPEFKRRERDRSNARTKRYRENNRELLRERDRATKKALWADPAKREHMKAMRLRNKYGVTAEQHAELLDVQRGRCAICRRERQQHFALAIDHCHDTGTIRGLLCSSCNNGLGRFKDDPALLRSAAAYIEKHRG